MAKILIIDDEEQLRKLLARIIALEGYEVAEAADCAGGAQDAPPLRTRCRAVRCQTARRQRCRDGRSDQAGHAFGRGHPADGLRQYPRRRAGHQERGVRLHNQGRRQQQDIAAAEPCHREGADAAPAGSSRGQTFRRAFVRPHHRFVGIPPQCGRAGAQGRRHGYLGAAHG